VEEERKAQKNNTILTHNEGRERGERKREEREIGEEEDLLFIFCLLSLDKEKKKKKSVSMLVSEHPRMRTRSLSIDFKLTIPYGNKAAHRYFLDIRSLAKPIEFLPSTRKSRTEKAVDTLIANRI